MNDTITIGVNIKGTFFFYHQTTLGVTYIQAKTMPQLFSVALALGYTRYTYKGKTYPLNDL